MKKIFALVLTAAMLLSVSALTGCGKSNEPVKSRRTNVYGGTEMAMPDDIQYISRMAGTEDAVYIIYEKQVEVTYSNDGTVIGTDDVVDPGFGVMPAEEVAVSVETEIAVEEIPVVEEMEGDSYTTYEYQNWLCMIGSDGEILQNYQIVMPEEAQNGYMAQMTVNGNILYMLYETWGESNGFYLYCMDTVTGDFPSVYDLGSLREDFGLSPEDYFYINRISVEGNVAYMNVENSIVLFDLESGKSTGKLEIDNLDWINTMEVVNGKLYYAGYETNGSQTLFEMDMATGEVVKCEAAGLSYFNIIGVQDDRICFQDNGGIFAYNTATGEFGEILNYINCDINSNYIYNIVPVPGDRFVYCEGVWNDAASRTIYTLTMLNRIPDEQMQEEIILTIASAYQNYDLRNLIIEFNRQNTGVRLNVKTYESYDNEENNWTGAVTQLNADITMGNVPDILVLESDLPVESYFSKGVLVDLNSYLDDPEKGINRADYLENIFAASDQNGSLYSLIPSFYIQTLAAKDTYVGTEPGWTMAEMLDVLDSMPEGMRAFTDYGRDNTEYGGDSLVDMLMRYCGDVFVDWETQTTSFDSEEFIRLIEFLKTCPEKSVMNEYYDNIDYDNYDYQDEMDFYRDYEMRFYLDTALFNTYAISAFNSYNQMYQNFAGDATMIGYPTKDGIENGSVIVPYMELGICAASPNRDSAWTFMKYLLTSESFFENTYGFVISKSWMEQKLSESEEYYADWYHEYTDEEWASMEEQYSAEYVQYMKNSRKQYTLDQGQKVYDLVKTVSRVQRNDKALMEIIKEELSVFFGGGRSAADTANIIDSRARIYISENS